MPKNAHICYGKEGAIEELQRMSSASEVAVWKINEEACKGDRVAFYVLSPLSSMVATGTVLSKPKINNGEYENWIGHYMAKIGNIHVLPKQVHIRKLRQSFPEWSWVYHPRPPGIIPANLSERVISLLESDLRSNDNKVTFTELSDIENIEKEIIQLTKTRSNRLRLAALKIANGTCCVCETDFSKILDGRGVRVLQVHHKKQLSSEITPVVTSLDNLAVVCANCHMLLHLKTSKALSIKTFKKMLKSELKGG